MNKLTNFKSIYYCYLAYFVVTFYAVYTFADESYFDLTDAFFTPLLSLFYFPVFLFIRMKKEIRNILFSVGALISTIAFLLIFYNIFIEEFGFGEYFELSLFLPFFFYTIISIVIILQQINLVLMKEELVVPATIDFFPLNDYIAFSKAILIVNFVLPIIITIAMAMKSNLTGADLLFLWAGLGFAGIMGIEKSKKWGYVLAFIAFAFHVIFLLNATNINSFYFYLYVMFAISVVLAALWIAISLLHLFHKSAVERRKKCD